MSMVPHHDQASAAPNRPIRAKTMIRPSGEGGVSTISSAAGRNASSSRPLRSAMTLPLVDFMDPCLQAMQRGVTAAAGDQGLVRAVLDQAAALEGDDAIHRPHGRQPVGDD